MNDPFATIEEHRPAFDVHARCVPRSFATPIDAAREFGLRADERAFKPIDRIRAKAILRYLLRFDLAYGSDLMTDEKAEAIIASLMEMLPDNTRFFTNGNWDNRSTIRDRQNSLGTQWVPATECTIDGGVLALADNMAACVWFGDED